jgi:isopentenyldiphosphate isomerase
MINHYQRKLYLAAVNDNNEVIGQVERWHAHREGILHRGFTVIIEFGESLILQHRKHPAFDRTWDLSFSSHQIFSQNVLQSSGDAINSALEREWGINSKQLKQQPVQIGSFYYRAKDQNSIYIEHEIDEIFKVEIDSFPKPNHEYAYGFIQIHKKEFGDNKLFDKYNFSPWVSNIFTQIHLQDI